MEVYKKVGRKYILFGHHWEGFPMDGIWQVRNGRCNNSVLITEEEVAPLHALRYRTHRDNLCRYLINKQEKANFKFSLNDMATWACDYFAEAAGESKEG
jgi:hypothetical protein